MAATGGNEGALPWTHPSPSMAMNFPSTSIIPSGSAARDVFQAESSHAATGNVSLFIRIKEPHQKKPPIILNVST